MDRGAGMRVIGTLVVGVSLASSAWAATISVTTTAIDTTVNGNCTIIEAIQAANSDAAVDACTAGSGADTILLPAGTYTLTAVDNTNTGSNGLPQITSTITVQGAGNPVITRSGAATFRFFFITSAGNLTLDGLTLTNGDSTTGGHDGGAIRNFGTLTVANSTLSGNLSNAGGSAIYSNNSTTTTIVGSTISNNLGLGAIGQSGTMTVSNSTFSGNPGGLINRGGTITITNSTIASNSGAGLSRSGITLRNTIVANNTTNCADPVTDGGNNLQFPGSSCGTFTSANPLLSSLANNGGPTQTMALSAGSPAINAGNSALCPATDQRGSPRVGTCDIGAFEFQGASCSAIAITPATLPAGTQGIAYSQTLTATGGTAPYTFGVTSGSTPAGLTVSTAGVVSGTPSSAGSSTFTVQATDASTCTGQASYTLVISSPVPTMPAWMLLLMAAGLSGIVYLRMRRRPAGARVS